MSISIHIPGPLRPFVDTKPTVQVDGTTVGEALNALTESFPKLQKHLRDDKGKLRSFVNVYLGEEDIRFLDNENTALEEGAELSIIPSIAGGRS